MKEYYLFLDESKPNNQINCFCLGGCAIEKSHYQNEIIPYLIKLKQTVFGSNDIILHETEIRNANGIYRIMRKNTNRDLFWNGMSKLFDDYDITVFGTVVTPELCKATYNSKYLNDEYFIALQIILENYSHFLEMNNGRGTIYIESRNPTEDTRLANHYYELMNSGTLFLKKDSLQNHLGTISFPLKTDNNLGLQIADFIPNIMKKHSQNKKQRKPSISENILNNLYDGGVNDINRFGLKIIM